MSGSSSIFMVVKAIKPKNKRDSTAKKVDTGRRKINFVIAIICFYPFSSFADSSGAVSSFAEFSSGDSS